MNLFTKNTYRCFLFDIFLYQSIVNLANSTLEGAAVLTLITDPTIRLSIRNEDAVKSIRQIKTGRVEKGETVEFPFWVNETHRCDVWQALYTSDSVMLLAGYVTYNASNTNCIVFYAELIDDEWRAGKCYYKTRDERVIHEEMSEEVALRHIAELRAASK